MCFTDELNAIQASADAGMHECVEYQIQSYVQEERIEPSHNAASTSVRTSSIESSTLPPPYDACASEKPRGKVGFLRRLLHRSPKKTAVQQELPSYREAELARAWAKVGIDINDTKHGPRPACTPEEWIRAMQDSRLL
ncbi:uncharacterized protein PAN0_005c2790 [Moesziomyces antarcticus]|uniref:Uncharacterized protein n=2 Tax=Pseudozyma antarctica TaxID=84753 RepID=A0A5C3FKN0_PSEA2|nr:uncharacterized protein PAN0_005c2790 [Moesziomyces antarcticus]GAK64576.1 conserved hypothetical protein [Moesziomyces antarcticus]SPO44914.1 uncharacterized protein PSANT_02600 [Moesziomyces antarcticus]